MKKILVVDNAPDVLRLLNIKLKQAGFEVLTAQDGVSAWQMAQSEQPEVVLCEVQLPKLDGLALTGKLKTELQIFPLVLLLTDQRADADIAAGFAAGADDYFFKPFSPQVLIERIQVNLVRSGKVESVPEGEASDG
jgi:two-component system alkaline phosphatase synthesis response regulator PhoP